MSNEEAAARGRFRSPSSSFMIAEPGWLGLRAAADSGHSTRRKRSGFGTVAPQSKCT